MERFNLDHIPGWKDSEPKKTTQKIETGNVPTDANGRYQSFFPSPTPEDEKRNANIREFYKHTNAKSPEWQNNLLGSFFMILGCVIVLVCMLSLVVLIVPGATAALSGLSVHGLLVLIVILLLVSRFR